MRYICEIPRTFGVLIIRPLLVLPSYSLLVIKHISVLVGSNYTPNSCCYCFFWLSMRVTYKWTCTPVMYNRSALPMAFLPEFEKCLRRFFILFLRLHWWRLQLVLQLRLHPRLRLYKIYLISFLSLPFVIYTVRAWPSLSHFRASMDYTFSQPVCFYDFPTSSFSSYCLSVCRELTRWQHHRYFDQAFPYSLCYIPNSTRIYSSFIRCAVILFT